MIPFSINAEDLALGYGLSEEDIKAFTRKVLVKIVDQAEVYLRSVAGDSLKSSRKAYLNAIKKDDTYSYCSETIHLAE